ncbi:MAG: YifB family Mg chelatase-like AAA ATPase [Hyphomicrobiales bacterium]|nr:YifB family Mg chelatase-like AAA ATPase [Hyphomicrobiales bacterium]
MYAQIATVAFHGVEAKPVNVQVMAAPGLPAFTIVGLADKAVGESRERVRAALTAVGLGLPPKRITVNLAPADLPKEGAHYDLPIALGLMAAFGAIPSDALDDYVVFGELSLDGGVAATAGGLPAAIGATMLGRGLVCPAACGAEAAWASSELDILAPDHLLALINHLKGTSTLPRPRPVMRPRAVAKGDLSDVKGQETAKRALEIAAAGGHHMLMTGPPGVGKSMLAERLPSILPEMEPNEALEVAMIQSMAGILASEGLSSVRPFRAPHHSASMAALVGGGLKPRPGEAALAHNGVLFLDELPEFAPHALDALRQPLESGQTVIARANHRIVYPSRLQLIAAMNPCRCGRADTPGASCKRGPRCAAEYEARVSGPFLDRMDIRVDMSAMSAADLATPAAGEASSAVLARVQAARARQAARYEGRGLEGVRVNAACPAVLLDEELGRDHAARAFFHDAVTTLGVTGRGYYRALRVARTIADLDGSPFMRRIHLAEALTYRAEARSYAPA